MDTFNYLAFNSIGSAHGFFWFGIVHLVMFTGRHAYIRTGTRYVRTKSRFVAATKKTKLELRLLLCHGCHDINIFPYVQIWDSIISFLWC